VLSAAVRSALGDALPDGIGLTELGAWRFRGLPEPIDLFEVSAPGLPSDFPALRSATAYAR
jgi:class 3 adenylate cyclase